MVQSLSKSIDFLLENAGPVIQFRLKKEILQNNSIIHIGENFISLSSKWDCVADAMWELSITGNLELLSKMSFDIQELYKKEKNLLTSLQIKIL